MDQPPRRKLAHVLVTRAEPLAQLPRIVAGQLAVDVVIDKFARLIHRSIRCSTVQFAQSSHTPFDARPQNAAHAMQQHPNRAGR